ncbi:type 1 glutamine amidotransferase [Methyloligella sp. 2.7D]|uniref:type 1 glutamine amidotransferase n=1 Tax=unclassified Methyloligella TaxID=2625955 RepID=UPI00157CD92A|nr:type 1 glutamine amidotransferase [Methyloligella sp. GL2]QKP77941.1 type 1 glutamine amidotransferase [Methyloligella sp. GL2]
MRILAVGSAYHMEEFEAGTIGSTVTECGGKLAWRHRRLGDPLPPSSEGYDGLIVFGGEMSVNDETYRRYFDELKALVREFHAAGKPILGSCLGAQIVAHAYGAKIRRLGFFECGFTRLEATHEAAGDALLGGIDEPVWLYEMHEDTFDLPDGAVHLLSGRTVPNQAFRLGERTYGFQCHFEVTPRIVESWNDRVLSEDPAFFERLGRNNPLPRHTADFETYQQPQEAFSKTIMRRWMALVAESAGEQISPTP